MFIFSALVEDNNRASGQCVHSFSTPEMCTIRGNLPKENQNLYLFILNQGQNFTRVGNSLVRYGEEKLPYESAHRRCQDVFKANLIEFRNEQEWNNVNQNENES